MLVVPAIDIRGGRVVRLAHGDPDKETVYGGSPAELARSFEQAGVELIHVVDLDGAFLGEPAAKDLIHDIVAAVTTPVQVGGGIRSIEIIEGYIALGASRVVLGTAAILDNAFLREAVSCFGPAAIIGGLDARDGKTALRGWVETSAEDVIVVGMRMAEAGVREVVHTDIGRDGVLAGPNIEASLKLAESTGLSVLVSGGISSLECVRAVAHAALEKRADGTSLILGCVIGRAIYEGTIDLAEAVKVASRC